MDDELLAERFEGNRARLRAMAYRMLGSASDADDAVQEAWLRAARAGADGVANLDGWLTTITSRVCLDLLRSRQARREELAGDAEEEFGLQAVGGDAGLADAGGPEQEAVLADSVGLALLVVLDRLAPAERVAFVLHDTFGVPFDEIAQITGRSPDAARQLASRARRRVRGAAGQDGRPGGGPAAAARLARQRTVAEAFLVAARAGDRSALLAVLDPDVVLRCDGGRARPDASVVLRGPAAVAGGTLEIAQSSIPKRPVLVNGAAGVIV
ncbi:MAG TPA: sigma-70 family RNA polymerase sigma factor, partial [Trebonia sp.]